MSRSPSSSTSTSVPARAAPTVPSPPAVTGTNGPSLYTPWNVELPPTGIVCACGAAGPVQYGEASQVTV